MRDREKVGPLDCQHRKKSESKYYKKTTTQIIQDWSSCKIKAWNNSGLNGILTHDLCDTGAVLYQPSYQAIWELVTLRVRNIPVEDKERK